MCYLITSQPVIEPPEPIEPEYVAALILVTLFVLFFYGISRF